MTLVLERGLLLLTVFFGFIGAAAPSIPFQGVHYYPYRLLLMALLGFALIRLARSMRELALLSPFTRLFLTFLVFWLAWAVVSVSWAADRPTALKQCVFLLIGTSQVFLLAYYLNGERLLGRLFFIWYGFVVAYVVLGIWEVQTGSHLSVSGYSRAENVRAQYLPSAFYVNTSELALAITICLPVVLAWTRSVRDWGSRAAGIAAILGVVGVLIQTNSKSNYIGVATELLLWVVVFLGPRSRLRVAAVLGAFLAVLLLFFPGKAVQQANHIYEQMIDLPVILASPDSDRMILYRGAVSTMLDTRGRGAGAGNTEVRMRDLAYLTEGVTSIHNWWLEVLGDYGLPVFAGYTTLYVWLAFLLYRRWKQLPAGWARVWLEGLTLALVGFTSGCAGPSSVMSVPIHWMMIGTALGTQNYARRVLREEGRS